MLLALDIGNSAVKAGLFEDDELTRIESFDPPAPTSETREPDYWHDALAPLLDEVTIDRIGLASVVPGRTKAVTTALQSLTGAPVVSVQPHMDLPFVLEYDTPETLGTDRLAAAAAGWVHHGRAVRRSVLVVDAGTAVNYEVIHRNGTYRGGAIGAGPILLRGALRTGTAQLPDVPLTLPDQPGGQSTQAALQSGIMWGLLDSVHGMTKRLAQPLPDSPRLVLTGGWSPFLADHLDPETHHAPHLVLQGIQILTTMNR